LAGLSISALAGSGLFQKAGDAEIRTRAASAEEQVTLWKGENFASNYTKDEKIKSELTKPEVLSNINKTRELSKEMSDLEETVKVFREYKKIITAIEETKEMQKDPELAEKYSIQIAYFKKNFYKNGSGKETTEKYIDVGENPVTVEIKFNTRVPIEDNIYVHKVKRATRNYTLDFRFNSNKMDIIPVSFGFMDENNIGNRVFIAHSDMGKQIRFRNWVLPGDGVIIVINKKNNADKLVLIGHTKDASNMEDIENINECRAEVAAEEVK